MSPPTAALLLVALAFAGKKKHDTPTGPAPDALAAEEKEACAQVVPENYRIFTGFAQGTDEVQALEDARNNAIREALDAVCSGKSETRCEVLRRHVADWSQERPPFYNPLTGKACAHVGISRLWIDDDKRDQQQLDDAVKALGAAIVEATPAGKPVALRAPVWGESGCDAGPLGVVVTNAIRTALATGGRALAPVGTPTAAEVTLVARTAGDRVYVEASVREWGSKTATPVPSIDVAGDLFPDEADGGSCWLDSRMGLPGGLRDGPGGLRVRIDPRFAHDVVCEGDQSQPEIFVNQPARVKVYSVDRLGTAYLIWPAPGQPDTVTDSISLGDMDYVRSPTGGEERLVAIAVPQDASFQEVDTWTAFCKHPRPFDLSPWPDTAAHAVGLAVKPYDDPACLQRGVPRGPRMQLPEVPRCPRRLGGPQ